MGARGRWPQATAGEMSGSEGVNSQNICFGLGYKF